MCGQTPDTFRYNERDFCLVGASNCWFFNCCEYGVYTKRTSTGCYRGFHASFIVDEKKRLVLIPFGRRVVEARLPEEAPDLNGVKAELITEEARERSWNNFLFRYPNVALPLRFTGSLLIGVDYRDDGYYNWQYNGHYCFQTMLELRFKNGVLKKTIDRSDVATALWRLKEAGKDGKPAKEKARPVERRTRRYERRALKWMKNLEPYWYPWETISSFHWFGR